MSYTGTENRVALKDRRDAERRVVKEGYTGDERRVGSERRVVERRSHAVDPVVPPVDVPVVPEPAPVEVPPAPAPLEIPAWDGVERRVGGVRRVTAERRVGLSDRRVAVPPVAGNENVDGNSLSQEAQQNQ